MISLSRMLLPALFLPVAVMFTTLSPADESKSPLAMTRKLIEDSTAAQRVEQSGNATAEARRDEARNLLQQAIAASTDGKPEESAELVNRARKTMLEAVLLAGPDASVITKRQNDYQDRLDSIKALMKAHDRVTEEKGAEAAAVDLRRMVDEKIEAAAALQQQGKLREAREVLDEAYVAAKVAIEQLRGGDTLVRTLNFASKEEEYHYEVDRNDTHKMLVSVLLREKIEGDQRIKDNVKKFIDQAAQVRSQAEKEAARGDFDAAVRSLEKSTKEIVRAIRSAGIYIPG